MTSRKYSHLKWSTDHLAVAKMVEVRRVRNDLHCFVLNIFQIYLILSDIQSVFEVAKADFMSRFVDACD